MREIEKKFEDNKLKRQKSRNYVREKIEKTITTSQNMREFIKTLKEVEIDTVLRINDIGFIYGITFIDHESKCVFNGSDLDKKLTAAAIQQKFTSVPQPTQTNFVEKPVTQKQPPQTKPIRKTGTSSRPKEYRFEIITKKKKYPDEMIKQYSLLKQLLQSEKSFNPIPFGLTGKKKKKKKKRKSS